MKPQSILIIAIQNIRNQKIRCFIKICFLTLLIIAVECTMSLLIGPHFGKFVAENKIGESMENYGIITLGDLQEWDSNLFSFYNALLKTKTIDGITSYDMGGMKDPGLRILTNIQNKTGIKKNTDVSVDTTLCYFADSLSLFKNICQLDEELVLNNTDRNDFLILLGTPYQSIPVGTVFQSSLDNNRQYIVVGYLPQDFYLFTNEVFYDDGFMNMNIIEKADDSIILIRINDIENARPLIYKKHGLTNQDIQNILETANYYGVSVSVLGLTDRILRNNQRAIIECRYTTPYLICIILSAIFIFISIDYGAFIVDKDKYAIYTSIGINTNDLLNQRRLQSIIYVFCSFLIASTTYVYLFKKVYKISIRQNHYTVYMLFIILLIGLLFGVIIQKLCDIMPIYTLQKSLPINFFTEEK